MKPYYDDGTVTIYHGDCREVLPTLGGVDLVVTDPPYVFGLGSWKDGHAAKAGGWGDLMNNASFYASWLRECYRLTNAAQGAAWVFGSWRSFPVLARASYEANWSVESLMVWDKEWIGPGGHRGLRPSYELVALFAQPGFAIANRGLPDIWRAKWAGEREHHPAEKPVALLRRNYHGERRIARCRPVYGQRVYAHGCAPTWHSRDRDRDRGALLRNRRQAVRPGSLGTGRRRVTRDSRRFVNMVGRT